MPMHRSSNTHTRGLIKHLRRLKYLKLPPFQYLRTKNDNRDYREADKDLPEGFLKNYSRNTNIHKFI